MTRHHVVPILGSSSLAPNLLPASQQPCVVAHPLPPACVPCVVLGLAYLPQSTCQLLPCRRVNALEHVVKPRLENTIAYIKVGRG